MHAVELAIQGVKGLPPSCRLELGGRLNVVQSFSADVRRTLIELFLNLLYPDVLKSGSTSHLVSPKADSSRAVLTLLGTDQILYRILRNIASGSVRLYRYDRVLERHHLLCENPVDVARFMQTEFELPDSKTFGQLFVFSSSYIACLEESMSAEQHPLNPDVFLPSGPGLGLSFSHRQVGQRKGPSSHLARPITSMFPVPAFELDRGAVLDPEDITSDFVESHDEYIDSVEVLEFSNVEDNSALELALRGRHAELSRYWQAARTAVEARSALQSLRQQEKKAWALFGELKTLRSQRDELKKQVVAKPLFYGLSADFARYLAEYPRIKHNYELQKKRLLGEIEQIQEAIYIAWGYRIIRFFALWICLLTVPLTAVGAVLVQEAMAAFGLLAAGFLSGILALRIVQAKEREAHQLYCIDELQWRFEQIEEEQYQRLSAIEELMDVSKKSSTELSIELIEYQEILERQRSIESRIDTLERSTGYNRAKSLLDVVDGTRRSYQDKIELSPKISMTSIEAALEKLEEQMRVSGMNVPSRSYHSNIDIFNVGRQDYLDERTSEIDRIHRQKPRSLYDNDVIHEYEDIDDDDYTVLSDKPAHMGVSGCNYSDGYSLGSQHGYHRAYSSAADSYGYGISSSVAYSLSREEEAVISKATIRELPTVSGRCDTLLSAAAKYLARSQPLLRSQVAPIMSQYLRFVSEGELTRAFFAHNGQLKIQGSFGVAEYESLRPALIEQVDFSLQLALVDTILKVRKLPIFFEQPLVYNDQLSKEQQQRLLNHLAKQTQLVALGTHDDIGGHVIRV